MPLLVLLQVALACAILSNVLFLGWQKLEPMLASSGVDGDNLILVDQLNPARETFSSAEADAGARVLRQVPGVRAVSVANGLPMIDAALVVIALQGTNKAKIGVNAYMGVGLLDTLGLDLVSGRDFLPFEYQNYDSGSTWDEGAPQPIIITQALADKMFGSDAPLGQIILDPGDKKDHGYRVVGIVRHLLRNQLGLADDGRADNTVLLAKHIGAAEFLSYAIRVNSAMRDSALQGVKMMIHRQFDPLVDEDSSVRVSFYNERRSAEFKGQRAALYLFIGVTLAVVIVTVIGIMGLTSFWVQKRTRQIGIRRALGARRVDIFYLFLLENAFIVSIGSMLGMLLAYEGNMVLMHYYELRRLPAMYLPLGSVLMIILGQLAVLAPALRATSITPIEATRIT